MDLLFYLLIECFLYLCLTTSARVKTEIEITDIIEEYVSGKNAFDYLPYVRKAWSAYSAWNWDMPTDKMTNEYYELAMSGGNRMKIMPPQIRVHMKKNKYPALIITDNAYHRCAWKYDIGLIVRGPALSDWTDVRRSALRHRTGKTYWNA